MAALQTHTPGAPTHPKLQTEKALVWGLGENSGAICRSGEISYHGETPRPDSGLRQRALSETIGKVPLGLQENLALSREGRRAEGEWWEEDME